MNNKEIIQNEIIQLNNRFINICLRVEEKYLPELSVQLNCSMSVLRMLRSLNYEQIENLVNESRFLLQPAMDINGIQRAANINSSHIRRLFISSSIRSNHD
jgi:hypothetical protein